MDIASCDELLTTTRTVRYRLDLDRPVPRSVVIECLRLAIQAPTGGNSEGWRWIVVDDDDQRSALAAAYRKGSERLTKSAERAKNPAAQRAYEGANYLMSILHQVPVLVIPCVEGRLRDASTLVAASLFGSILPATWSFMLALRSRGLGSAYTTLHLTAEDEVADILGIPARFMQAALLPVAYTKGTTFRPAPRRPVEEVTCWNTWDGEAR
jgi:nitroreductase